MFLLSFLMFLKNWVQLKCIQRILLRLVESWMWKAMKWQLVIWIQKEQYMWSGNLKIWHSLHLKVSDDARAYNLIYSASSIDLQGKYISQKLQWEVIGCRKKLCAIAKRRDKCYYFKEGCVLMCMCILILLLYLN